MIIISNRAPLAAASPLERREPLYPVLQRFQRHRDELLQVLDYPNLPLHNNRSENDLRELATTLSAEFCPITPSVATSRAVRAMGDPNAPLD